MKLAILGGGGLPGAARVRRAAARHRRAAGRPRLAVRRRRGPARRRRARCWPSWAAATPGRARGVGDHRPRHGPARAPTSSSPRSGSAAWRAARTTSGWRSTWACSARRRPAPAASRTGCAPCPSPLEIAERVARARPRRLGHQLHQPGRHDHRGDAAGAGRPGHRHLRLADRAGPPGRPRARRSTRTARRWTTSGSTTSAGCAALVARRPGRAARPARRRHPALRPSRRAGSSAPTGSAALGAIPNEYLYYYYFTRDAVASIRERRADPRRVPRSTSSAASTTRSPRDPLAGRSASGDRARARARAPATWPRPRGAERRGARRRRPRGGRLREVALAIMAAIARNERATMILNVRNGTTLPGLPPRRWSRCRAGRRRRRRARSPPARSPGPCSVWCSRSRRSSS